MPLDAPTPPAPRPVVRRVLVDAPEVCVANVALGLTVYLAEPLVWARSGAASLLARFATLARGTDVRWWTTSRLSTWRHAEITQAATLAPELMRPALVRPRHLLSFRWVDDVNAPGAGFHYLEIDDDRRQDERRPPRAGVLQIFLPQSHNPSGLVELARAIGDEWPVWSAVGGYVATSNAHDRPTSFETAYRWCRRYLGLGKDFAPFNRFFNSCWNDNGTGAPIAGQCARQQVQGEPVSAIVFLVPGTNNADLPYDFTVNGFALGTTKDDAPDGGTIGTLTGTIGGADPNGGTNADFQPRSDELHPRREVAPGYIWARGGDRAPKFARHART